MPRTFKIGVENPSHSGCAGSNGDIAVTPSGRRFVRNGPTIYDWELEGAENTVIGGGPYREAQTPTPVKSSNDSDPHRRWLINNADWKYVEMDWSDKHSMPARIVWSIEDGIVAELRTTAYDGHGRNRLLVRRPRLGGVKQISLHSRQNGGNWEPYDDDHWSTQFDVGADRLATSTRRGEMCQSVEAIARGFVQAYDEVVKARSTPT